MQFWKLKNNSGISGHKYNVYRSDRDHLWWNSLTVKYEIELAKIKINSLLPINVSTAPSATFA